MPEYLKQKKLDALQAGVDTMTEAAATRCRIVMVAIHGSQPTLDLSKFFWRKIKFLGARVYEPVDFDEAIALVASGPIDCNRQGRKFYRFS